jgi:hypothetical protein
VIRLENVKRNRAGKLTIQNGVMQFEAGTTDAKVPTAAIDDLSIGSETTQAGGKAGTVAKTAAIATPYDSGAALSLLLRTKVDILTVSKASPSYPSKACLALRRAFMATRTSSIRLLRSSQGMAVFNRNSESE